MLRTILLKITFILMACCLTSLEAVAQTSKNPTTTPAKKKVVVKTVVVKKPAATTPEATPPKKKASSSDAKPATQKAGPTPKDTTTTTAKPAENQNTATDSPAPLQPTIVQTATCGYQSNPPLPYMPVKLDVLFIGNSFSIDTSTALPEILSSVGISNVNVYVLYKGGCSMKQHYEYYKSGEAVYELWQYNIYGGKRIETAIGIKEVMRRVAYDVVVFQQYSLESGDYASYEPYLSKIIQAYNITKLSPRTTFAFNQTWAYSSKHKSIGKYGTQLAMYKKICDSVKKMKAVSGIDVIIPCGTAVQNARNVSSLVTDNEFTRDNQHIDLYMGRYLLACTFFEAIIAPCLSRNIRNDITIYGKQGTSSVVNSSNRHVLQNCARLAVANNYEVSEFINQ